MIYSRVTRRYLSKTGYDIERHPELASATTPNALLENALSVPVQSYALFTTSTGQGMPARGFTDPGQLSTFNYLGDPSRPVICYTFGSWTQQDSAPQDLIEIGFYYYETVNWESETSDAPTGYLGVDPASIATVYSAYCYKENAPEPSWYGSSDFMVYVLRDFVVYRETDVILSQPHINMIPQLTAIGMLFAGACVLAPGAIGRRPQKG
jgi:hypothetical protein